MHGTRIIIDIFVKIGFQKPKFFRSVPFVYFAQFLLCGAPSFYNVGDKPFCNSGFFYDYLLKKGQLIDP